MNALTETGPIPCDSSMGVGIAQSSSIVENLQRRKLQLTSQLKEVTEALDALQANPEITKILHLVTRAALR